MDYHKLGLRAGLEIHQQLDTGKLFCRCPSLLRKDDPHFQVRRRLHKVAGETGEIDSAVEYEASLNREFVYEGYYDTTCLIELDEEPPKQINEEALDEAIKIALLLNCEIYPITQIMRKTVIDGSNTSGFQRTVLIAHDGFVETSFGKVSIDFIFLEEDSARPSNTKQENNEEISPETQNKTYRLDRLGIPLVEIATGPHMHTPEQIKEVALKIGEIVRACKVKRGIGTIRQDLNISIKGHDKVEIKGFQEPSIMIKTVELEVQRQLEELQKNKTRGEVRASQPDGTTIFLRPMPGGARMYPETDLPLLKISKDRVNNLKKHLPKLKEEIKAELRKKGLSEDLINLILDSSENFEEFKILSRIYEKNLNLVAKMVTLWRYEFASKHKKSTEEIKDILSEKILEEILEALNEKRISEGDVKQILEKVTCGISIEQALKIDKIDENELEEEIRKIMKEKPGLRPNAYMGLIMQHPNLKGRLDARKAMEIINKIIK